MPIKVHIFSGRWAVPSESPFCLKLLTWLKIADIPFESVVIAGPPKSTTGKAPYIEREDGSILEDSAAIIDVLTAEHGVTVDTDRTAEQRATMTLVRRTVETHLYFASLLHRWRDHWPEVRAAYFDGNIPAPVLWVAGPMIRRATLKQANGQGMGKMPWERVVAEAKADLDALSTVLGEQNYFMGSPGITDAVVYGSLENLRSEPFEGPLADALAGHDNLVRWLDRMRDRYWAEHSA